MFLNQFFRLNGKIMIILSHYFGEKRTSFEMLCMMQQLLNSAIQPLARKDRCICYVHAIKTTII